MAHLHSGTTGRAKLRLEYQGDRDSLPDTVFCKLAPFDPGQRTFLRRTGIAVMEASLYANLSRKHPVRVPRVWRAEVDGRRALAAMTRTTAAVEDLDSVGLVPELLP